MKFALAYARAHLLAEAAKRKKAVAAFLAPIVVAQLARLVPGVHVDVSVVDQLIAAAITGLTVHGVTNKPAVTATAAPTPPPG